MRRLQIFAMLFLLVGSFTRILAGLPVTVSFQDGVNGYTGTRDTKLLSGAPAMNYGADAKLEVDGLPDRSSLLYWDLTSIPSGNVIQRVHITVYVTNGSGHNYEFYQLLRPWLESEATWNQYRSGQGWQSAGADGSGDRGATVLGELTGSVTGHHTLSLNAGGVAVVQSWVNDPAGNHGLILLDYANQTSKGLDFSSRETGTISNRPKLTVTYGTDALPDELVIFSVTGDYPYGRSELADLERHIDDHNLYSPSDFFVHVGDIFGQSEGCRERYYRDVADRLKKLAVPAYIVIGDNEWTDCSNPDKGFKWWEERFTDFEQHFCGTPFVEHQDVRHENWAFVLKGVLFVGINIPNGDAGGGEEDIRLQDNADWVDFQFQVKGTQVRAAVVFGQAGPSDSRDLFFDQFVASSRDFAKPVFYIQGDDHRWKLDNPWSAPNMQRLVVDRGADEDPPQITVTMDPNNPFEIVREPWRNNPPLYNRHPCVEAGPDQAISEIETIDLRGVASDDGVPTNPGSLTTTWSKASGPGEVVFGNADALNSSANFTSGGIYRLRLTAFDGELTSSDELSVAVQSTESMLTIDDIRVDEGNAGTGNAVFTVSLSPANGQTVTVDYATADITATAGSDYTAVSGQLNFSPGQDSQQLTVSVDGDITDEPDETFVVNLSDAVNASIGDAEATGTITDDDTAPVLSIDDVAVTEGNSGTVNADFTVTLSAISGKTVTVDYVTADATASADGDYSAGSGQVRFQPGEISQSVTVAINGDVTDESDETFVVNLSNAVNATITDAQGTGTIGDDDPMPALSIADMGVTEGNTGTVEGVFTLTLTGMSSRTVSVDYATADGTATTADNDYVAVSDTLNFSPGQTSRQLMVVVNGDETDESNETFVVNLSNAVNATIEDSLGTGTIADDDGAPSLSIDDVAVTEGNTGTVNAIFTVTLIGTSGQAVTVDYATSDGTATAGSDYVAGSGQVRFQPGEVSQPVMISVNGDTFEEPYETFLVNLSNAVNAIIGDNQGNGTIANDDGVHVPVTVSFQDGVDGYTGTRDTKLLSQSPTTNFGNASDMEIDGSPDGSTLLSWDLTDIPAGCIIQSVDITVYITNTSGQNYEFYQLLRPWVELEATWNAYASGLSWQITGADGSEDHGLTVLASITGSAGPATVSINSAGIAVFQSWVDNPATNHGFIIVDYINATDGLDFASRENVSIPNRPKLTVTYIPGPVLTVAQQLPREAQLLQNYPNPFNPTTKISYAVPDAGFVTLKIFDTLGREVQTLVSAFQVAGIYTVELDVSALSMGTYFYQLRIANDFVATKKMLFLK